MVKVQFSGVRRFVSGSLCLAAIIASMMGCRTNQLPEPGLGNLGLAPPNPDASAKWPWTEPERLVDGVRFWRKPQTTDGSLIELYEVDFRKNPRLSFEIYDQDEDDSRPFDNQTDFWKSNIAQIVKRKRQSADIVLACNGLFHGYDRSPGGPPNGFATHIGLNVIRGTARYNFGSPRWAFGMKMTKDGPKFDTLLSPSQSEIEQAFDYGAVGAQCLIRHGQPLALPKAGERPSTRISEDQVGGIAGIDGLRTTRVSLAWEGGKLFFLFVREPDNELQSKLARRDPAMRDGGWTLADLQRFWLALGVSNAINSDGGMVGQWIARQPSGFYRFHPPVWIDARPTLELDSALTGAPEGGGTLMSYLIRIRS